MVVVTLLLYFPLLLDALHSLVMLEYSSSNLQTVFHLCCFVMLCLFLFFFFDYNDKSLYQLYWVYKLICNSNEIHCGGSYTRVGLTVLILVGRRVSKRVVREIIWIEWNFQFLHESSSLKGPSRLRANILPSFPTHLPPEREKNAGSNGSIIWN